MWDGLPAKFAMSPFLHALRASIALPRFALSGPDDPTLPEGK